MAEAILSIIVCFVVGALINWMRSMKYQRKFKPDYARTRSLFDMTKKRLEQKGLGNLMLADYRFKTVVGSPQTTDINVLQIQLQNVLMEILTHLHLMPDVRLIVTNDPKRLDLHGVAGEYHHDYEDKQIRLLVEPKYTADNLIATLCHESAHYFA